MRRTCEIDILSDLRNVVLRMIELVSRGESGAKEQETSDDSWELLKKIEELKNCGDVTIAQAAGNAFN